MIKKVDILGIQLDNYTVREAIMCVERYLSNNVLNTIESISLQMLIDSETNPVLKEVMSSLDLAIIGEKEIIQAAGLESMQRIRETEENDFIFDRLFGVGWLYCCCILSDFDCPENGKRKCTVTTAIRNAAGSIL